MSVALQPTSKMDKPLAQGLAITGIVLVFSTGIFLHLLGVPLGVTSLLAVSSAVLCIAFKYPIGSLGAVLMIMPLYPLTILVVRFFGPSFMMSDAVKASDRIMLLGMTCILWLSNRIRLKSPDWFLLASCAFAVVRLTFGGNLLPLLNDFDFAIAYAVGRLAPLNLEQQDSWANRAVWLVAGLSVVGMVEVFIIGEGPRTVLYLATAEGAIEGGGLNAVFHAEGFSGLREAATMFGPLQFASLCMFALIVWWVYSGKLLPGIAIAAGLVCTVTRSAWLGTTIAIPVLAVMMQQKKRLLIYASLALVLVLASIPIIGLSDYLFATKTGSDLSAQGHQQSLIMGVDYALDHPFGVGPGNAGMFDFKSNANAVWIENTYLTLAAEYGIPTTLCFVGFLLSSLWLLWPERTQLSYTAVGTIIGFSTVMMVAPLHDVFTLASWIWFPVGLAIKSSKASDITNKATFGTETCPATRA